MAIMPGAAWKPIGAPTNRMAKHDIVCIHTMVGTLAGTDAMFRRNAPTGTNSHFGTGPNGEIWQWVDTAFRSAANLYGNGRVISIENADFGRGFPSWNTNDGAQVPAFTPKQIEANAQILAWANRVHGIPLELVPDSKPGRRGVAYHRQGVPGYMIAGGEQWSNSRGKVCPGNKRIAQIPQIIDRARQIVSGASQEETIMGITFDNMDQFHEAVSRSVWALSLPDRPGPWPIDRLVGTDEKTGNIGHMVTALQEDVTELKELVSKLVEADTSNQAPS